MRHMRGIRIARRSQTNVTQHAYSVQNSAEAAKQRRATRTPCGPSLAEPNARATCVVVQCGEVWCRAERGGACREGWLACGAGWLTSRF